MACSLAVAGTAYAEVGWPTPTAQAVAMESEFLIDPAYPPPVQTAVCEIDSGVADSAVSEFSPGLLDRFTMQAGDPVSDTHDQQHGTWMARYMGAARDGVGMVGIWPGVRIVSVRALVGTGQTFPYSVYKSGIAACMRLRETGVPLVAISLSLGGVLSPATTDVAKLRIGVADARGRGIAVFAATGNSPGPVLSPAREAGVVGVGAGNAAIDETHGRAVGQLCFGMSGEAPYDATGRDLVAPGCFLDGGTPDGRSWSSRGSSEATAMAAGLYAAARAYNPQLTHEGAEEALLSSAQSPPYGGWISARRFFSAAGINWQSLVSPGRVIADQASPTNGPIRAVIDGHVTTKKPDSKRYATPNLSIRKQRGRVLTAAVGRRNLPVGASLYLRALGGTNLVLAERSSNGSPRIVMTLPYGTRTVDLRIRARAGAMLDSKSIKWRTNVRKSPRRHRFSGREFP